MLTGSDQRRLDTVRKASWSQNSKLPHLQLTAEVERSLEALSEAGNTRGCFKEWLSKQLIGHVASVIKIGKELFH